MTRQIALITFFFIVHLGVYSQTDQTEHKIDVIIPNCGLDDEWHQIKADLDQNFIGVYKTNSIGLWDNFLLKNYDVNELSIPKFLITGISLKDSILTSGKWINRMLYPGESIQFTVNNLDNESQSKYYHIYAKGKLIETEQNEFPYFKKIQDYELIVVSHKDNIHQTIEKMDILSWPAGGFEGGLYLYWIGDLNGDKKMDMLLGSSLNYRGIDNFLFLSFESSKSLFKKLLVGGCAFD